MSTAPSYFSRQALTVAVFIILASLPASLLRDLLPYNEIAYVQIAVQALSEHHFFTFYDQSLPFTAKQPLFMWLNYLAYLISGPNPAAFMLLLNAVAAAGLVLVLDHGIGQALQESLRGRAALTVACFPLFLSYLIISQPYLLGVCFTLSAVALMARRCYLILKDDPEMPPRGKVLILLCVSLGLLTQGIFALLIPLATLLLSLLLQRRFRLYFRVLGRTFWIGLSVFVLLWLSVLWWEGGSAYLKALLEHELWGRLTGELGHKRSAWYFLLSFWYLSLPLGLVCCYCALKLLRLGVATLDVRLVFALVQPAAALLVISLPVAKEPAYLLYALPLLGYLLTCYLQQAGSRDPTVRLLLVLGMLPFALLLFAYYPLKAHFALLDSVYIVCALLFILLCTALAMFKIFNSSALNGAGAFAVGALIMLFTFGFAVPSLNPYVGPVRAIETISALHSRHPEQSSQVCVAGERKVKLFSFIAPELNFTATGAYDAVRGECRQAYRLLGRKALLQEPELESFKERDYAQSIGDKLILAPAPNLGNAQEAQ
ncbi:MAG: hypothetical protein IJ228_06805 [Succinivibrio sp.]|nr:hypothetical protein [Succinivibrio sp.]